MGVVYDSLSDSQKLQVNSLMEIPDNKIKPDNRRIDLTDLPFGDWKVVKYAGHKKWICICSCGKISKVLSTMLRNGSSTSCGHGLKAKSLIGKRFGYLEVTEKIDGRYHKCICHCGCGGTEKIVATYDLKAGKVKSCGINTTRKESIIGKKFNHWTVLEYVGEGKYKCECDCESKTIGIVRRADLASGQSKSCGHSIDSVEKFGVDAILNYLNTLGVKGEYLSNLDEIQIKECNLTIKIVSNQSNFSRNYLQNYIINNIKNSKSTIIIFEYEWYDNNKRNIVKWLIKNKVSTDKYIVYAKRCHVEHIGSETCRKFVSKYHLQGATPAEIRLGLYCDSTLLGIMTFGKSRFNPGFEYELIRLAWMTGVNVVGGAEKLFKAFIAEYNPISIVSYCDISKFNGGVYFNLGFKPTDNYITPPNYVWVNLKATKVLSRYQTQKQNLIKHGFGIESDTEDTIMERLGYLKIYDSGNARFAWYRR